MSCCLVLQSQDNIIIGADTAACYRNTDGSYTRANNNLKKLYRFGKEIMFAGGFIPIRDYIVKNIKMDGERIDKKHLQNFLKALNCTEPWNDNPIGILIAGVDDNGESYLYQFATINNYELDIRTMHSDGIQVWTGGFMTRECLKAANAAIANSEFVEDIYVKTYKDIACNSIGGNINVYQLTTKGINQLLSDYDLQDGITPKEDRKL